MIGVDRVINFLNKITQPVISEDDIKNIATISANGDSHIGELITEALNKVLNEILIFKKITAKLRLIIIII